MGYAKLNFTAGQTGAQALFDIVRVVTGNVSNVSNLTYASITNSEIVNTLGQNWSVQYGSIEPSTASYVITTPCVTAGKTHKVWLLTSSNLAWPASSTFTSTGGNAYINVVTVSDASSNVAVSNPTWYSNTATAAGRAYRGVEVNSNNVNVYLNWSRYHIMIYGLTYFSNNNTGFFGSFEYPETSLTQFTNTAPVAFYSYNQSSGSSFLSNTTSPSAGSLVSNIVFQGLNIHQPLTSVTSGVYNLGNTGFGTMVMNTFNPNAAIDTGGVNSYTFVPFYWSLPSQGIPMINLSYYSKFYRVNNNINFPENILTVGAENYVYLTLTANGINGTNGIAGIAMLKA